LQETPFPVLLEPLQPKVSFSKPSKIKLKKKREQNGKVKQKKIWIPYSQLPGTQQPTPLLLGRSKVPAP
jgi:hypothetical protein